MVPPMERFAQYEPTVARRLMHLPRLQRIGREGLLAKNVLAGFERSHGPLAVKTDGKRVVHDVDAAVGQEACVALMGARNPVRHREATRAVPRARRDGDDLDIAQTAGGAQHSVGNDARRAKDAYADRPLW